MEISTSLPFQTSKSPPLCLSKLQNFKISMHLFYPLNSILILSLSLVKSSPNDRCPVESFGVLFERSVVNVQRYGTKKSCTSTTQVPHCTTTFNSVSSMAGCQCTKTETITTTV